MSKQKSIRQSKVNRVLMKNSNEFFKTALHIFAVIGLIGANVIAIAMIFIPDSPIGNWAFITVFPFLIGVLGFVVSTILFNWTKAKKGEEPK
ncbi:hypothetical protein [Psychrobacillus sp. FSL H8-0510]|uniref:hypothetical protein n=1 Tax=Psychrobacillus sp. FSL H8-0510 TaxID=2921394 RepID=UPI0030FBCB58